jgi:cell division transport system permease protein
MDAVTPTEGKALSSGLQVLWNDLRVLPRRSWQSEVLSSFRQSIVAMLRDPLPVIVACLIMVSALVFFLSFSSVLGNLEQLLLGRQQENSIQLYLSRELQAEEREAFETKLHRIAGIKDIQYRSPEMALADFRSYLGADAIVLNDLEKGNPLPASFEVILDEATDSERIRAELEQEIHNKASLPVEIDTSAAGAGDVHDFLQQLRGASTLLLTFVVLLAVLVMAGAMQLILHHRRQEVEIMRYLGADRKTIAAPLLLEGLLIGLLASVIALLLGYFLFSVLAGVFVEQLSLWGLQTKSIHFLSWPSLFLVCALGPFFGLLGSFLGIFRYLRR